MLAVVGVGLGSGLLNLAVNFSAFYHWAYARTAPAQFLTRSARSPTSQSDHILNPTEMTPTILGFV